MKGCLYSHAQSVNAKSTAVLAQDSNTVRSARTNAAAQTHLRMRRMHRCRNASSISSFLLAISPTWSSPARPSP
eukprot:4753778-Pleurochrysis_carterae.AAC.1